MPLLKGKSKEAFSKNVATEMHAGKPQDQALAIAYAQKRRKGKHMASGGEVPVEHEQEHEIGGSIHTDPDFLSDEHSADEDSFASGGMVCSKCGGGMVAKAEGGEIEEGASHEAAEEDSAEHEDEEKAILQKILAGVRSRHMAE